MIKQKIVIWISLFTMLMLSLALPAQAKIVAGDVSGGQHTQHVNIAIFHKLQGQESFVYPKKIEKGNVLQSLNDKAQFISINHTAGLKDGDVITVNNDVLRDSDNAFNDFGVDCQFPVHIQGENVILAGICQILMVDQNNREIEHKGIVKSFVMRSSQDWTLIYEDKEDAIAIYVDKEAIK